MSEGKTESEMTLAELDAALSAAMDDDWDAGCELRPLSVLKAPLQAAHSLNAAAEADTAIPHCCSAPAAASASADTTSQRIVPGSDATEAALDAALRAAMDADWDGSSATAGSLPPTALPMTPPTQVPPGIMPLSMGYLSLPDGVASTLVPGVQAGMELDEDMDDMGDLVKVG
jgi:hypothetical protein